MFLLLLVCLIEIIKMTSNRFRYSGEKENCALNGQCMNCCFLLKNESKSNRGMTEHLHQKTAIPQYYSLKKRPLTSPNTQTKYNCNYTISSSNNKESQNNNGYPEQDYKQQYDELSESNLKKNAQIVINNLKRDALKILISHKSNSNIKMSSPESDCNSNPHIGLPLGCSIASSQDFTHDNSDYQWFLDYGYRDGVTHNSILSSLSASYNGIGELSYYDDLARNIDANLAEVDIESFRAEDINSLLKYRKDNSKHTQDTDLDNSICKSKQLFSPVKESQLSVDSLDLDCYPDDGDIILTCQANKDNYTIAFEGSAIYSDDSFYDGQHDLNSKFKENINLIDDIIKRKALEVSMSRSDTGFTTWSKLKKGGTSQLQRYPSGNNNTSLNITRHTPHCLVHKSSSLPDLQIQQTKLLNVSQAISNSTVDSYGKMRTILPMCPMPESSISDSASPAPLQNSSSSNDPQPVQPSFNLVKLFIKQKSSSTDTCMDVSSGCWPSDSNLSGEQRQRKKSMNDSGKGSALSRHDEDNESDFQYDSLDVPYMNNANEKVDNESNNLCCEAFDSPSHKNYKEINLNIKNYPKLLKNVNNNNSFDKDSLKETNKSLSDTSHTSENVTQLYTTVRKFNDRITRSIQTSLLLNNSIKVVPPSFLAQLNKNNKLKEAKPSPVYVIYPNYALPDLGFVNTNQGDLILSPLGFKDILPRKQRPMSATDAGDGKTIDYKHVIEWKSLALLLPAEYRKMFKHIPEVEDLSESTISQRPMFCMSPPLRRNRPLSCDCSSICSLSSGSSQPPSSGFRGSSTMLTDSEFEITTNNKDPLANMYVYQYENDNQASERPPSGRIRGILRRNINSKTKNKRNSMFEEEHLQMYAENKRRSLQEPYYAYDAHNNVENYLSETNTKEQKLNNSRVSYRLNYPEIEEQKEEYATKAIKTNYNYITELNEEAKRRIGFCRNDNDIDARVRAGNFLSHVPKAELKYYAEIANILESIENCTEPYDRKKLRNEVSKALSQKRVSFNQTNTSNNNSANLLGTGKEFKTPPNSPNISVAMLRTEQKTKNSDREKQEKIQSNRFKRLQIQWELLSKENNTFEKELIKETRSGLSTPTTATVIKSKIPRPVSYPTTKNTPSTISKNPQSPSRLATPKKYNAITTTPVSRPRTPSKPHNTPKKSVPTPRATTRCTR